MSLELRLHPIDALRITATPTGEDVWGFSHTILQVRAPAAVHAVEAMAAEPLPAGHSITAYLAGTVRDGTDVGEKMYGTFDETPYGDPFTWVRAGALAEVLAQHAPDEPTTAYVKALAPETRIVLGWT